MDSNVFLSLGSNIGDEIQNLNSAIEALNENNSINILIKSSKSNTYNSVLISGGVQFPLAKMDYKFIPYLSLTYLLP